jgi:clan AA aspartic protease (TIGR02281 family)
MYERDDQWDMDSLETASEVRVFWPVLRKFGGLFVIAVLTVGGGFSFLGGGDSPNLAAQQAQKMAVAVKPIPQPGPQADEEGYEMSIPAGANGHFVVDALANGRSVRFLVDTGASGIMLTEADAKKAGIQPASLTYSDRIQTATGEIPAARTRVREIRIGDLVVDDMEVWITRAPMPISLLGMTFLRRLASYEARSDRLILRW